MTASTRYRQVSLLILACLFFLITSRPAYASISVLLEEPYGGFSHLNPAGHTAVYLNHVCADTPVHLRRCQPDEPGVVISRYDGIGNRDWIAVPLIGYLFAVQDAQMVPREVTEADVQALRDTYRRHALTLVAPTMPDGTSPRGNWYQLAGSAFNRSLYGFTLETSEAQDDALISYLNHKLNREKFNGFSRNCADFVRVTVNRIFPRAIGRNYIAGLGVSSPKSVARSFSHYAKKHPALAFSTFQIKQVPGTLPRSHPAVTLMEGITKEFGLPLIVVCPVVTGVTAMAWLTQGRLDEPRDAPELNLRFPLSAPETSQPHPDSAGSTLP